MIYKWTPFMEIGKISYPENRLEIVSRYEIRPTIFRNVRGSTTFVENEDCELVGIVHFCENTEPLQYYHIMVVLEKDTFRPIRYSEPFCFQHIGIEFCI